MGSTEERFWPVGNPAVPGERSVGVIFLDQRVVGVQIDDQRLEPNDPRLEWLRLAGRAEQGGPFPPEFRFAPHDRAELLVPDAAVPGAAAWHARDGLPVVRAHEHGSEEAHVRLDRASKTAARFEGGPDCFFTAGPTCTLFSLSEAGSLHWHREVSAPGATPMQFAASQIGDSLGALLPHHLNAVAVGRSGFMVVAGLRPVWISSTPFAPENDVDVFDRGGRWGAPAYLDGCFFVPVRQPERFFVAWREDGPGKEWRSIDIAGVQGHVDESGLGRPAMPASREAVWAGKRGFLHVEHRTTGPPRATWRAWGAGVIASNALPLYRDPQGRLWAPAERRHDDSVAPGYALVSLTQHVGREGTNGLHLSGGGFTIQGNDYFEYPFGGEARPLRDFVAGRLVIPLLAWKGAAVVGVLEDWVWNESSAFFEGGKLSKMTQLDLFLLMRSDQAMVRLNATFSIRRYDDVAVFLHRGRLFAHERNSGRCYAWRYSVD